MKRITVPVALVAGFVDGMIIGVGLKTSVEPSKEGLSMLVLETFCKNPITGAVSFCSQLWLFGLAFFVAGVLTMAEDIQVNGILYVFGLAVGVALIVSSR